MARLNLNDERIHAGIPKLKAKRSRRFALEGLRALLDVGKPRDSNASGY